MIEGGVRDIVRAMGRGESMTKEDRSWSIELDAWDEEGINDLLHLGEMVS